MAALKYRPAATSPSTEARTYYNRVDAGIRTQSTATDFGTGRHLHDGRKRIVRP